MKKISFQQMRIGQKLSLFMIVVGSVILVAFYFFEKNSQEKFMQRTSLHDLEVLKERFLSLQKTNVSTLSSDLDILSQNREVKEMFLEGSREKLYALVEPLFSSLKEKYAITHLYFYLPDRTIFLRVHDESLFGDLVNRKTLLYAEQTKEIGSGLELGKTAFALRAVAPYYDGDRLIGYLEFGKEIDEFLDVLKRETGGELSFWGDKNLLDRSEWERVERLKGADADWDRDKTYAFLGSTSESGDALCLQHMDLSELSESTFLPKRMRSGESVYQCSGFLIFDPDGERNGALLLREDITQEVIFEKTRIRDFFIFFGIILGAFFVIFNEVVRRIITVPLEQVLNLIQSVSGEKRNKRIKIGSGYEAEKISNAFNEMADSVEHARETLEEKIQERTKNLSEVNKFMVGRELRMIELKKEIMRLKKEKDV